MDARRFVREVPEARAAAVKLAGRYRRRPEDAEDVAGEALARAWGARRTILGDRLKPWACAAARNASVDAWKYERTRRALSLDATAGPMAGGLALYGVLPDGLGDASGSVARSLAGEAVRRAVAGLPSAQAAAVRAVDLRGDSYEEAARALGVPVGTVRSRLYRARAVLAGRLKPWA